MKGDIGLRIQRVFSTVQTDPTVYYAHILAPAAVWRKLSNLAAGQKTVSVHIEPHTRGEVLTVDTVMRDVRAPTSSTILYLDGSARDFGDSTCSGTQSSRRLDERTVEILRSCGNGGHVRLIRTSASPQEVLILDINEQDLQRAAGPISDSFWKSARMEQKDESHCNFFISLADPS